MYSGPMYFEYTKTENFYLKRYKEKKVETKIAF